MPPSLRCTADSYNISETQEVTYLSHSGTPILGSSHTVKMASGLPNNGQMGILDMRLTIRHPNWLTPALLADLLLAIDSEASNLRAALVARTQSLPQFSSDAKSVSQSPLSPAQQFLKDPR